MDNLKKGSFISQGKVIVEVKAVLEDIIFVQDLYENNARGPIQILEREDLVAYGFKAVATPTHTTSLIQVLQDSVDKIEEQDFTGLLEENDKGYRENAVLHILAAMEYLKDLQIAERAQRSQQ